KALSLGEGLGEAFPLLLILDSIQDTHNVGAILRTADCSGVSGIIITKHNSAPINETVVKTSAGATEHVKICQVNNLSQAIKELKDNGFWIVGSSLEGSKPYTEVDYKIPIAVIVGNEEKGIKKLTAENCDFLVYIPMKGKIQSLNVSVATGILLFEILRQRSN
ncbi:MAG: 23S rRNA (guanosine(2251)-2'-O)-methyltransferase RlmB, partial [Candidatus Lokiarchaeota archaeon]|nr:23S rRNA (guanosine(2251)-2'-O)-methyltransferase RlmB [Candidatus Lokiarchaeota archaeon]